MKNKDVSTWTSYLGFMVIAAMECGQDRPSSQLTEVEGSVDGVAWTSTHGYHTTWRMLLETPNDTNFHGQLLPVNGKCYFIDLSCTVPSSVVSECTRSIASPPLQNFYPWCVVRSHCSSVKSGHIVEALRISVANRLVATIIKRRRA